MAELARRSLGLALLAGVWALDWLFAHFVVDHLYRSALPEIAGISARLRRSAAARLLLLTPALAAVANLAGLACAYVAADVLAGGGAPWNRRRGAGQGPGQGPGQGTLASSSDLFGLKDVAFGAAPPALRPGYVGFAVARAAAGAVGAGIVLLRADKLNADTSARATRGALYAWLPVAAAGAAAALVGGPTR